MGGSVGAKLEHLWRLAVEGTGGAQSPFFSADGRWVGFVAGGSLKRISVDGGPVLDITSPGEDVGNYVGASWTKEGTIVYAGQSSRALLRVRATGGASVQITALDENGPQPFRRWPQVLDDKRVLYTRMTGGRWEDAATA